jgi:hypothetical protein
LRSKTIAAAIAVAACLAVPAAVQAHPFTVSGGAFSGEFPTIDLEGGLIAGRSDFEGGTPPGDFVTKNMRFGGFTPRPAGLATANSDIAFEGKTAYQGTFRGFRIIDIRQPASPTEVINYEDCRGSQGDIVVYRNILARSWDVPAGSTATCDGQTVPAGWEGLHIFDVSDPSNPELVAQVDTRCGSHTATGVPDQRNQRLLIYNTSSYSPSLTNCGQTGDPPADGIEVVEVPLGSPEDARSLRFEDTSEANNIRCHDTGVILGKVQRAACAGGVGIAVWSMDEEDGGSLDDPKLLYTRNMSTDVPDFTVGHSAAFSNDGETLIIGHEPGGGTNPRCTPTNTQITSTVKQTDDMKSFFFLNADTGATLAKWTLPRDQTVLENCTLHNYNVVPTKKRDVLVHGSYQSGIGVLDFSDLSDIREVGFADPKPLNPNAFSIGGDWSSHWYNGFIYQSDITRGFLSWQYTGGEFQAARQLNRLNPQTQVYPEN